MTATGMLLLEGVHIAEEVARGYGSVYMTADLKRALAALENASEAEWLPEYFGHDRTLVTEIRSRA